MGVILKTKELCKFYGMGTWQVKAVDHVNLEIEQGEFVAIVGKSGSGKSTLLHMMGGLDCPTLGHVYIRNVDIYKPSENALAVFRRRKIGFVFQAYNLISSINVWENIILPLGLDKKKVDEAYVKELIGKSAGRGTAFYGWHSGCIHACRYTVRLRPVPIRKGGTDVWA